MYKYFMGKHSNLKNRTEKLPIVIEIDELASRLLNFWLDKYCLDFDRFVEGAKIILKDEIEKIMYESQDGLALYLENGRTCFLILMNDDVPRCTLHVNNDEFTLNVTVFISISIYVTSPLFTPPVIPLAVYGMLWLSIFIPYISHAVPKVWSVQ